MKALKYDNEWIWNQNMKLVATCRQEYRQTFSFEPVAVVWVHAKVYYFRDSVFCETMNIFGVSISQSES